MAETTFDVIVIGSGPGGYVTAIRAAQLGFRTAIVERSFLGGICSNWCCIPTKALLRSAEIFHYLRHAKDYGLSADNVNFDAAAVIRRSRGVAGRMNAGVGFLMKKNKVTVIWGEATIDAGQNHREGFAAPKDAAGPGSYQAKHIIIATGGVNERTIAGWKVAKNEVDRHRVAGGDRACFTWTSAASRTLERDGNYPDAPQSLRRCLCARIKYRRHEEPCGNT
jgi:pyruvate/2-oxoglutarate dehydrogenase complex dihydrolipoamide dehydrogenase (E3) component